MGSAQEFFEDTVIETAVVIDVNMQKWTVDVATQYSEKNLYSVPWSLPYLHPENGEGILFVPEIGTQCLLCTPSDGEEAPFIIGFLPIIVSYEPRDIAYADVALRLSVYVSEFLCGFPRRLVDSGIDV